MKKNVYLGLLVAALLAFSACSSQKKMDSDDDFSVEGDSANSAGATASAAGDDLSLDAGSSETPKSEAAPPAKGKPAAGADADSALENELNSLDSTPAKTAEAAPVKQETPPAGTDELSLDEPKTPAAQAAPAEGTPPAQAANPDDLKEIPPPQEVNLTPEAPALAANAQVAPAPEAAAATPAAPEAVAAAVPVVASGEPAPINSVQYKANANGGTVAIGSTQPLTFTTRFNATNNQFVVEVQNSLIPKKLKRSLNTKDMASSIGSVDIYQKEGSNVSRFVVQLRPGASEPIVQPEGNSLLIIGGANAGIAKAPTTEMAAGSTEAKPEAAGATEAAPEESATAAAGAAPEAGAAAPIKLSAKTKKLNASNEVVDLAHEGLLNYDNLEDFLMSNSKFYGKKISIETADMDIRDAIKFIADESNTNIIMDDGLSGRVNIKLREVPWDQAFVLLLKSKKLVYKRQGNVIRVARLEDIKKDEDDAVAMKEARKVKETLVVKRFFIGYAPLDDLSQKIKDYLAITDQKAKGAPAADANATQGKVIADKRTNSLIITETEDNIKRIESLLSVLDTQPPQILIEGKVVEAQESFARGMGIKWTSPGEVGKVNSGGFSIDPAAKKGPGGFGASLNWGQLDFLGSLSAQLTLGENESRVKVLSSPRITVLSSESATINSTQSIQVNKGTTTVGGAVVANTETQQVGIQLAVTPQSSNEGTVSLTLNLTRSFGTSEKTFSRSANTKLIVRSGQTAVVGGIYESSNTDATGGVPGLRDVPVIGNLFRNTDSARDKTELLIFVTPTILKPIKGEADKTSIIK